MSLVKLAFHHFKKSFRNYASMILSLAFTILILFNFVNLTYAETFRALGERNKEYIDIIIRVISFVLICFMFFFIWYASNVFLTARKKEIGIYIFMGLSNQKIARLYMLEMMMTGAASLILGIGFGVITTFLFQRILLEISEISIDISFVFTWKPLFLTAAVYIVIYLVFVIKGYRNIVKSSVLEMISAARQNEYVKTNSLVLMAKAALGVSVLANGYYLAVKGKGMAIIGNLFGATVLVIIGTYLLFGGFLPLLFQKLARDKPFLYKNKRTLWINNVVFRMRKNYRTYAMTCVLLTCSVTALATSFAQKEQYDNMLHFRNTYTFQIISTKPDMEEETAALLKKDNDIVYSNVIPIFSLPGSYFSHGYSYGILSYSDVKKAAEDVGLDFPYEELADDETIFATHLYLMSFMPKQGDVTVEISGKTYHEVNETTIPYLGYMQESMSFYIVNDKVYEELLSLCRQLSVDEGMFDVLYTYNYKIADMEHYEESLRALDSIIQNTDESYTGRVAMNPDSDDIRWIKIEYSLCIFMFLVFVLASGSILFMKLYNDAFEEKSRYDILHKLGISDKSLGISAAKEMGTAYALPFLLTAISSWFAVHALEKLMSNSLQAIYLVSIFVIFIILMLFYGLSVRFYKRNAGLNAYDKNIWNRLL